MRVTQHPAHEFYRVKKVGYSQAVLEAKGDRDGSGTVFRIRKGTEAALGNNDLYS